jgi:hypothetical protein
VFSLLQQKIVIRLSMPSDKCQSKTTVLAAKADGNTMSLIFDPYVDRITSHACGQYHFKIGEHAK